MNVIITGAGSGIGLKLAQKFVNYFNNHLERDNHLILISRNLKEEESNISEKLKNGKLLLLPLDLSDNQTPQVLIKELSSSGITTINGLINNAGHLINKPFGQVTYDDLLASYMVNTFAPYLLISALLPFFKNAVKPAVVNISSMGGFQGSQKYPGLSAYSSAKAALCSITECLAAELKDTELTINALCLGAVNTPMLRKAFPDYTANVSANQMAEYILNFYLTANKVMNGQVIPVTLSNP
jgi:3-oxoacyl-[acyl-carrier protein] reductase